MVYTGICVVGYFMTTAAHFFILAILVGMVQGGRQALSRSLFASLIPRDKSGEFFGFFAVVEKFAGIFGPLLFAVINALDRARAGARSCVIAFFAVGGLLLAFVDVEEGQRQRGPPNWSRPTRSPRWLPRHPVQSPVIMNDLRRL